MTRQWSVRLPIDFANVGSGREENAENTLTKIMVNMIKPRRASMDVMRVLRFGPEEMETWTVATGKVFIQQKPHFLSLEIGAPNSRGPCSASGFQKKACIAACRFGRIRKGV